MTNCTMSWSKDEGREDYLLWLRYRSAHPMENKIGIMGVFNCHSKCMHKLGRTVGVL